MSILIIGSGPTGLTLAIELKRRGIDCKIIDKKPQASTLSRAVGINARSLEILEKSNVAPDLLKQGYKINNGIFHDQNGKTIALLDLNKIKDKYNFLLALPQDKTEKIMQSHLQKFGLEVEYGCEFIDLKQQGSKCQVTLGKDCGEVIEEFDLVIGCDGAHSKVRQALNIDFIGYDYDNLWSIADFEAKEFPHEKNAAHVFLHDDGHPGFVIRIGCDRYRAVCASEDAIAKIMPKFKVDEVHRSSTFKISVRQAKSYQQGNVYLAGDAAHVHSPAGGRGMNLGIEDAYILAKCIATNDLENYTNYRHKIGKKVLKLSENLVFMATLKNPFARFLRKIFLMIFSKTNLITNNLTGK